MICSSCHARNERPCTYSPLTMEYYGVLIEALRHVAYRCGYAIAVHGSLKTDIDLIACPWRDSPIEASALAEEIRLTAERIIGHAEQRESDPVSKKPCGRLAWSFYLQPFECGPGPYIDFSVMPVGRHMEEK